MSDVYDFSQLKANRGMFSSKIAESFKPKERIKKVDERFFKPNLKTSSKYEAIVRFMPSFKVNGVPTVEEYTHYFNINGKKMFFNCPNTIGEKCPICVEATKQWDDSDKVAQNRYSEMKKKKQNIAVIYVKQDINNPENNGKFMFWKFGSQVMTKISEQVMPDGDLDEPINIFDIFDGKDFYLILKNDEKKKGWVTYESSKFQSVSPLAKTDKEISKLWKEYTKSKLDVNDYIHEDEQTKYSSYEAIKERYDKMLGNNVATHTSFDKKSEMKNVVSDNAMAMTKKDKIDIDSKLDTDISTIVDGEDINLDDIDIEEDDDMKSMMDELEKDLDDDIPF